VEVVDRILPGGRPVRAEGIQGDEWKKWMVLKGKAKEVMRKTGMLADSARSKTRKPAPVEEDFLAYT